MSQKKVLYAYPILLVLVASGCASQPDENPMWWRKGVVLRTMRRSEMPQDLDRACVDSRETVASEDPEIAVVNFRAGRAPYSKAFVLAEGATLKTGDHVFVEPSACKMKIGGEGG